jgi:hypothetical protein
VERRPIARLSREWNDLSEETAYAIQVATASLNDEPTVGFKLGYTSAGASFGCRRRQQCRYRELGPFSHGRATGGRHWNDPFIPRSPNLSASPTMQILPFGWGVYAPCNGEVVAVNSEIVANPSIANHNSYAAGWVVRVAPSELQEL